MSELALAPTTAPLYCADSELERSLASEWDARVHHYPLEKFPFHEWALNRIREMGYPVEDLSYFHEVVPQDQVYKVTKQLCADTNEPSFRRMLNRFIRDFVVPVGKLRPPIAAQRFMNVRIMLPTTPDLFFAYHTGLLYGHGIASRTIWVPFVDVTADEDRTRSMQIIGLHRSRELIRYATENRLKVEEMTALFAKESHQIKAGPGSCCFFSQEHIHGSGMPNTTGKTRISMDFRLSEGMYGDLLGRKIPAGYVHFVPETEEEEERQYKISAREVNFDNGKPNIFYVANNTSATYTVPVHLQRYAMYDYINKKKISCDYEVFDLEDMLHLPTLWHVLEHRNANVVMYSIFALPEDEEERNRLLETAVKNGNIIHFANEDLHLTGNEDLEIIQTYLKFAKYGNSRLPIGLPLSNHSKDYFDKWSASLSTL